MTSDNGDNGSKRDSGDGATTPVWFITGSTSGFGYELAKAVLARGWKAVLGARKPEAVAKLVDASGGRARVVDLDVTDRAAVTRAVAEAEQAFGRIDVLVNNAGYGYLAAIEEGEDDEIRAQFETNVFGLIAMTQATLPVLRRQRSGHVVNVSSIGGLVGFAATGFYHATKFAVEGLSESLAAELKPLGIRVTVVEPGPFRTDWAGRSMRESKTVIDDYADTAGKRREQTRNNSGKQPGDPVRAAEAIIKAVQADSPPLRLLLGAPAVKLANQKLDSMRENFDAWEEVSKSADFPAEDNA